jgi:hypothetical protein
MTRATRFILSLATAVAWTLAAQAQTTTPPPVPATPPAPDAKTVPPEQIAPPVGQQTKRDPPSMIHPPAAIDPAIVKPTPPVAPQSMPVLPPPGTPGGNPSVQPK